MAAFLADVSHCFLFFKLSLGLLVLEVFLFKVFAAHQDQLFLIRRQRQLCKRDSRRY